MVVRKMSYLWLGGEIVCYVQPGSEIGANEKGGQTRSKIELALSVGVLGQWQVLCEVSVALRRDLCHVTRRRPLADLKVQRCFPVVFG